MPEYLHPGVFVEEVPSGSRPIEGISTSTAGFIGTTSRGIPNRATFVTSWTQFVRQFGGLDSDSYLPYAVSQFFANGGKRCYVVRVLNEDSSVAAGVDIPSRETTVPRRDTLRIRAKGNGGWGNELMVRVEDGTDNPTRQFKLIVYYGGQQVEVLDNLSMSSVETEVADGSRYIEAGNLNAHVRPAQARAQTANPLGTSVPFAAGGESITIEMPDGTLSNVPFAAATSRDDVLTALNNAWGPRNISVSLDESDHLVVTHNAPGFDRYFLLSGTATDAGRPLEGLAGFAQGAGPAIGATLKSVSAATFAIAAAGNRLTFTVNADPAFDVDLTPGNPTATEIASQLNDDFQTNRNRILTASVEGNRVVVSTANRGEDHASLAVSGTADGVLQFRDFGRANSNSGGQGRNEPAFLQSDEGPFALTDGANFSIQVNNGTLGADSDPATVITFNAADIPNLQQVSARTVADTITAAAPAGTITASVLNNRVIIEQTRRGRYYTVQVTDGAHSPNMRLNFETLARAGFEEGDGDSPYYRPGFSLDASQANQPWNLAAGDDGSPVSDFDYVGSADRKTGLHALDDVDDVSFLAIPGNGSPGVIGEAVGYCSRRGDCLFIADSPEPRNGTVTPPVAVRDFILNRIPTKTRYAALYYSWVQIADPVGVGKNPRRLVPPSGFVAGVYARTDLTRGVHKAPAGTEATVLGALDLEYPVTDPEQDILNPYGVNCLRKFQSSGIVVWGARTMGTQQDPEGRYIPIVRYTIYLKGSIFRGTQWAVFEPNDVSLWEALTANITDFMMGEFRKGALAGRTPDQAFRVKCDEDLNPESEVAAGRVNMEVAFAPLRPAEFVIIRISQKTQSSEG